MKEYDATELAYRNGYRQGCLDGIKKFSSSLKKYYSNLPGETVGVSVVSFVDLLEKEMERRIHNAEKVSEGSGRTDDVV